MSKHVNLALQESIFSALNSNSELLKLVEGVCDGVKDNQDYPYIVIGENDIFSDSGSHTTNGFNGICQIDVYSQSHSTIETKIIQSKVYEILHNSDLIVEGFTTTTFRCNLTDVNIDPDGRTYHGILQFGFIFGNC